jgi:hypothetical protein
MNRKAHSPFVFRTGNREQGTGNREQGEEPRWLSDETFFSSMPDFY